MGCVSKRANTKESPEIDIELSTSTPVVEVGETPQFSVSLVNRGKRVVTLVQPGDGSHWGWRTPVISWSIINVDVSSKNPHHAKGRCGNINPLKRDEVFTLDPGEKITLNSWIGPLFKFQPGTYEVSFHYSNVPNLKWSGIPLGKHDVATMERVRKSTPFKGKSNSVKIVVNDKTKNKDSG